MANSPTVELTNAPVFPVGEIDDPPGRRRRQRLHGRRLRRRLRQGRARPARHVLVRRASGQLAAGGGRHRVIIYNEGNTPARQNPIFVDNQPTRRDDPGRDLELHARQRAAAGLQAEQEPDRRLQGLRLLRGPLPQPGDRRDARRRPEPRRRGRRAPGLRARPARASTTTAPAPRRCSRRPRSSPRGHYNLRQKIRFAWWGAEENGLVGLAATTPRPSARRRWTKIDVMLDYDMLASPNYIRGIYDGDGDDPPRTRRRTRPARRARARSRRSSTTWFRCPGPEERARPFDGRSDYVGFTQRGIPAGGVFAGAEGVEDRRAGDDLRRCRGRVVRPVLPPDLRQPVDDPDRRPADQRGAASTCPRSRRRGRRRPRRAR